MKSKAKKAPLRRVIISVIKLFTVILLVLTLTVTVVGLIFAIYIDRNIEKSIDESIFELVGSDATTKLYYYDFTDRENRIGEAVELTEEVIYGGYRSKYVDYQSVPKDLINAFVSIEDKRFYSHSGVDWQRTLSAGANYFLNFSDSYGGSTITQQLIKNVTGNDDFSFQRKIQEILWALDLETKMSKEEIMGMYLNIINLSQGCYGVGAAAEYYFSKDVSELSLLECACIAAITNSPSYYDPLRNPENNSYRRDLILKQMYEQGYISEHSFGEAYGADVILNINSGNGDRINSWYADMVIEDVINDLVEEKGYSRQVANLMIYTGGLKIYTAMDPKIQQKLEEYYADSSNFYSAASEENPQSSMIIIDPATGDILAIAGAVGEKSGNRLQNFATQTLRPAGSVVKPISVYAPALEEEIITWSSVYDDVPVNFGKYNFDASVGAVVNPKPWPKNSNGVYRGLTNINYAVEHSINTVVVRVLEDLGLEKSFDYLKNKLRVTSIISVAENASGETITDMDYAALALGQFNYGVTVREITAAYSALANNGVYNEPRSYLSVTDSQGKAILEREYEGRIVFSEETATLMTMMLENVIKNGTATSITLDEAVECAGKTGTTQNNYDRWFIGYTPYFICGTWYGYEYPKAITDVSSNVCVKFWNDVMTELHEDILSSGETLKSFSRSDNIVEAEYCMDSGLLMTEACRKDPRGSRAEKGYFAKGTEPTTFCTRHVAVPYDIVEGGVASEDCPPENIEYVGLINVTRVFPAQIYVTDAQYVWRNISLDVLPATSPELPFFANLLGENEYCGISRVQEQFNRYCRAHFNYYNWQKRKDED